VSASAAPALRCDQPRNQASQFGISFSTTHPPDFRIRSVVKLKFDSVKSLIEPETIAAISALYLPKLITGCLKFDFNDWRFRRRSVS